MLSKFILSSDATKKLIKISTDHEISLTHTSQASLYCMFISSSTMSKQKITGVIRNVIQVMS